MASAPATLARVMSVLRASIWLSRSLTRPTSAAIRVSASLPSFDNEAVMRLDPLRKSSSRVSAWVRSRLEEGSSCAEENAA